MAVSGARCSLAALLIASARAGPWCARMSRLMFCLLALGRVTEAPMALMLSALTGFLLLGANYALYGIAAASIRSASAAPDPALASACRPRWSHLGPAVGRYLAQWWHGGRSSHLLHGAFCSGSRPCGLHARPLSARRMTTHDAFGDGGALHSVFHPTTVAVLGAARQAGHTGLTRCSPGSWRVSRGSVVAVDSGEQSNVSEFVSIAISQTFRPVEIWRSWLRRAIAYSRPSSCARVRESRA